MAQGNEKAPAAGMEHPLCASIVIRLAQGPELCPAWSFQWATPSFNFWFLWSKGRVVDRTLHHPLLCGKRGSEFPRRGRGVTTCRQQCMRPGQPHCGRWKEAGLAPAQERSSLHLAAQKNRLAQQVLTLLHIWTPLFVF